MLHHVTLQGVLKNIVSTEYRMTSKSESVPQTNKINKKKLKMLYTTC